MRGASPLPSTGPPMLANLQRPSSSSPRAPSRYPIVETLLHDGSGLVEAAKGAVRLSASLLPCSEPAGALAQTSVPARDPVRIGIAWCSGPRPSHSACSRISQAPPALAFPSGVPASMHSQVDGKKPYSGLRVAANRASGACQCFGPPEHLEAPWMTWAIPGHPLGLRNTGPRSRSTASQGASSY